MIGERKLSQRILRQRMDRIENVQSEDVQTEIDWMEMIQSEDLKERPFLIQQI